MLQEKIVVLQHTAQMVTIAVQQRLAACMDTFVAVEDTTAAFLTTKRL